MSTPQSIAFEVELDANKVPSPMPETLKRRLESEEKETSLAEINLKLAAAEDRKRQAELEKVQKARENIERVHHVAEKLGQGEAEREAQLQKLQEKLSEAEKRKEEIIHGRIEKLNQHDQHIQTLLSRSESTAELEKTIEEKLVAAELRRKALEEEKLSKLAERQTRQIAKKDAETIKLDEELKEIEEKLAAADTRRKAILAERIEKQKEAEKHAEEVRKRAEAAAASDLAVAAV